MALPDRQLTPSKQKNLNHLSGLLITCTGVGCPIEEVFLLKKVKEKPVQTVAGGKLMAIRKIRYNNDSILRKKCKEVTRIDDKIRQILDDMMDTLHHTENGAALAANQLGILNH